MYSKCKEGKDAVSKDDFIFHSSDLAKSNIAITMKTKNSAFSCSERLHQWRYAGLVSLHCIAAAVWCHKHDNSMLHLLHFYFFGEQQTNFKDAYHRPPTVSERVDATLAKQFGCI